MFLLQSYDLCARGNGAENISGTEKKGSHLQKCIFPYNSTEILTGYNSVSFICVVRTLNKKIW